MMKSRVSSLTIAVICVAVALSHLSTVSASLQQTQKQLLRRPAREEKDRKLQFLPFMDSGNLQDIFEATGGPFGAMGMSPMLPPSASNSNEEGEANSNLPGNMARLMQMPGGLGQLAEVFSGLAGALGGGGLPGGLPGGLSAGLPAGLPGMGNPASHEDGEQASRGPFDPATTFSMLFPTVNRDVAEAENDPEKANSAASQIMTSLSDAISNMIPQASQQVTQKAVQEAMEQAMEQVGNTQYVQQVDDEFFDQVASNVEATADGS